MYEKNQKSIICISIQTPCSCACCVAVMTAGGLLGCDLHTWIFFPLRPCRSLQTLSAWLWIVCRQYFYGVILAGTLKDIICPKANPGSSWLYAPGHSDTEWRIFYLDRGCVQVFCKDHSIFGSIQPLSCCLPILKPVAENKASLQLRLVVK